MRNLIFILAFALTVFSGRCFAATTESWHGYTNYTPTEAADEQQTSAKDQIADGMSNFAVYAGRQCYTPDTIETEHGDMHQMLDAVRIGMNFKFD